MKCENCDQPAREWVTYRSRTTGKLIAEPVPMCADHVQREFNLMDLSMVDIELERIAS